MLRVGYPQEAAAVMGPIVEPALRQTRSALTTPAEGEVVAGGTALG
jgi:hypothetical protein